MPYEIAKKLDIIGVELHIASGPIGISLSGGADSSLLLYLLMSNHPGPIHAFTMANDIKRRTAPKHAQLVIDRCLEITGNRNVTHHVWYRETFDPDDLHREQRKYHEIGLFGLRYAAITADPPPDVVDGFYATAFENPERSPSQIRPLYYQFGMETHVPFTNVNKLKIAEIYQHLGLMDDLFPLTRSCESLELHEGHCGQCWWCEERRWGFGRL